VPGRGCNYGRREQAVGTNGAAVCGVTGILAPARDVSAEILGAQVTAMADAVRHRGPDDAGVWVDAAAGIAFGHRRLSIIDLSAHGHQPMVSPSGRYVLTYNGEIYNFAALRASLEQRGHAFRGHSDTEVLLALIDERGLHEALTEVTGMFAFGLWDRRDRVLHLARDRLGEKPLYYGWCGATLLFGSELKALRAHPAFCADVDRGVLALYLRRNCVPSPYTIHTGILKVPPGTTVTVRASDSPGILKDPVPYWSLRTVAEHARDNGGARTDNDDELADELEARLRAAVTARMYADVPLGAFLSGGIDSSMVVALMQANSTRPVRTFTIGFDDLGYDESADAARVARHLGTDHVELRVGPDEARAVIPRLPTMYDEPFADSSQIPTFLVSQLTRRHVTVSLSGDGGDELFGGYNRYLFAPAMWARLRRVPRPLRRAGASVLGSVSTGSWDQLALRTSRVVPRRLRVRAPGSKMNKLIDLLPASGIDDMYSTLTSHWKAPEAVVLGAAEAPSLVNQRAQWPALDDPAALMMYLDTMTYLPDDILVKVDRATMAVSLEARVPYLDHDLVEFAWRLPPAAKIRDGQSKWLLRRVLDRYVPATLVERPKTGFALPLGEWLRGPLREWAEDLLAAERLRAGGFFAPEPVRAMWDDHRSRRRDREYELWDVLMFQAWLAEAQAG